jgi:uncharacterized membrane protein YdjX (TVP38/TMEM64 family)
MLVAVAILFATDIHHQLSLEAVIPQRARLRELVAGHAGIAIAAYALIYAGTVALSIPGAAALTVIGGFLFGWLVGGVVAVFAATAGATVVFRIAHTSFGETLAHQAGPRLRKLIQGFHEDAFAYLLFLRLVPLFPFWLVNLAPGLVGTPPATFVLATLVGILPGTFAFSFAGAGLDSVVAAQMAAREACLAEGRAGCSATLDLGALVTPELIAACAALGLAALVPVAARRLFGRHIRGRRARPHVDRA